jgi:hypothetical protein
VLRPEQEVVEGAADEHRLDLGHRTILARARDLTWPIHHAAVEQVDVSLRLRHPARVMGGQADGCPAGVQLAEHLHQRLAVPGVEVAGRLVGQQDRGRPVIARATATSCWCPPESDPAALRPPRVRPTRSSAASTRAFLVLHGNAAQRERVFDVLVHGQVADQVEALEDQADVEIPHARRSPEKASRSRAVQPVTPGRRRVEQPQDGQEGGLAAPDGPDTETYSPRAIETTPSRVRGSRRRHRPETPC